MWFELPDHLQQYRGVVKIPAETIHLLTVSPEPAQLQAITGVLQQQLKVQLRLDPELPIADRVVLRARAGVPTVVPAAAQVAAAALTVHQVVAAAPTVDPAAAQVAAVDLPTVVQEAQVAAVDLPTVVQEVQVAAAVLPPAVQEDRAVQAQVAVQEDLLQDDK